MRPSIGAEVLPVPPRKLSFSNSDVTTPTPVPGNRAMTTFFMTSESMLEASGTTAVDTNADSSFGIRSLDSTADGTESEIADDGQTSPKRHTAKQKPRYKGKSRREAEYSIESPGNASARSSPEASPLPRHQRRQFLETAPQLLTPTLLPSPAPGSSVLSSPKSTSTHSLRLSDEESLEDGLSQAVVSSGDEDVEPWPGLQGLPPQLIMPSIMMPRRRPFTEQGKNIGRLKVLIAGASGVGKTSLIKSLVQICEDIVHVDPISHKSPSANIYSRKQMAESTGAHFSNLNHIVEVYASTKAYPVWWSDFEESKIMRRRTSSGETVLERNICFVDTPGYNASTSMLDGMDLILQYIEGQMAKNTSFSSMSDADLLSMLGGDGGFQVDLVLYLILDHLMETDIEYLMRLSQTTNVIPLIAKADTLSDSRIQALKTEINTKLEKAGAKPFNFSPGMHTSSPPYTVCSSPSNNDDNMDASLLMSPDYVQPLLPSELSSLVAQIFDQDNASWLRHSAAKKIIQWRRTPRAMSIITPTSRISFPSQFTRANTSPIIIPTTSTATSSLAMVSYPNSPLSYPQARIADHTQREERIAQIHLANWAASLQKSLQNERARYEAVVKEQRAAWLKERLEEVNTDRCLASPSYPRALPPSSGSAIKPVRELPTYLSSYRGLAHQTDPLGLMKWNDDLRRYGWVAFQVAGSLGVIGAVAVWLVRTWGPTIGLDGSTGWLGIAE